MELNIFNLRKLRRISERYRNFQSFLGEVLNGDRSLVNKSSSAPLMPAFELQDQIEEILTLATSRGIFNRKTEARVGNIFELLAPYFEAGLLLQTAPDVVETRLREMFVAGRFFISPKSSGEELSLFLPEIDAGQVAKCRARPVLELVQLDSLQSLRDTSAFLITPVVGWSILLFCSRPHPWQVGFIERTRNVLMQSLATPNARGLFGRERVAATAVAVKNNPGSKKTGMFS